MDRLTKCFALQGDHSPFFADVLRRLKKKKNHWLLYSWREIAKACGLLDVKIESCDGADKQIKNRLYTVVQFALPWMGCIS